MASIDKSTPALEPPQAIPDAAAESSPDVVAESTPNWQLTARALLVAAWSERPQLLRQLWRDLNAREAWLELHKQGAPVQRVELGEERCRIGRATSCDVVVASEGISRVHCIVEKDSPSDRDYTLEDFNSANGVFWRDRRLRSISLRDGDDLQLGSPLKAAPMLRYRQPRTAFEQFVHAGGIATLILSTVSIVGLLLATSITGGSRIRLIGGPVKIVAENGQQIDQKEGSSTALPSLDDYPIHLRQALLASEDSRFGWNSGLDLFGTMRSLLKRSGGGSGLTQQVARIYYPGVGNEYSLSRKLKELWVAWQLETGFNKNEILKMYLDRAHLGLGSDGFEQASRLYFRKSARQLDLAESAFLVGLLPSPNGYSPCFAASPGTLRNERLERQKNNGKAEEPELDEATWTPVLRRNLVLERMYENQYINEKELVDARRRPLNTDPSACRGSSFTSYPFFSDYIQAELEGKRFGLNLNEAKEGGNYYVVSTIDPRLQALAQAQIRDFIENRAKPSGVTQAALISLSIDSGDIVAYVGGGDYKSSSFDRVQAKRQPGSTFKLFAYLAALEAGAKANDTYSCAPYSYVAGCSHGPITADGRMSAIDGFAFSENAIALRIAEQAGLQQVINKAKQLGISTPLEESYSMVLGGNEVYLYEMARAYAVVANGGRNVPMHGVTRIYDLGICKSAISLATCPKNGVTTAIGERPQQLISPAAAEALDQMMRRVVQVGTGQLAGVVEDARGKTGTTNNGVDVWFIGYSPSKRILTGIWMGNDDNRPAEYASGKLAAELWGNYMKLI